MVLDGVMPNNEGRGYVLRKILRRAYRHGKLLNIEGNFLSELVDEVIEISKDAYPDLIEKKDYIKKVIALEEERFQQTINQGLDILKAYMSKLTEDNNVLSGEEAFKLYDTYGFPIDLTKEILGESSFAVDEVSFNEEMQKQRERARAARGNDKSAWEKSALAEVNAENTEFNGYIDLNTKADVIAIISNGKIENGIFEGTEGEIILNKTSFYPEGGGQIGDTGELITSDGSIFKVTETVKGIKDLIVHRGVVLKGMINSNDLINAEVDLENRNASARNHTATHIIHKVLKEVLGDHIEQKGSLVDSKKLRFDFSHFEAIEHDELLAIENTLNNKVYEALSVNTSVVSIEDAKKMGATALFGEKYGDTVRVVSIGDFSMELCGGTHIANSSQIGMIKIISESGIAAGVRRIEAITGKEVFKYLNSVEGKLNKISSIVKSTQADVEVKVESLNNEVKSLQKEIDKMQSAAASSGIDSLINEAIEISGVKLVLGNLKDVQPNNLRELADKISDKVESSVVVLASNNGDKVALIAMASKDAIKKGAHAGNIIKEVAKITGGGGGGRPNMAQAGGKDSSKISDALKKAKEIIEEL